MGFSCFVVKFCVFFVFFSKGVGKNDGAFLYCSGKSSLWQKSFSENTEAYVESPMFARLLTLKSDVDRLTSMRYTDTLNDFTTGVLWPKDRDIFAQPNKKHDFFELVYVYEGSLNLQH